MTDDDEPKPRPRRVMPHDLAAWGVSELRDYIGELRAEIERAEAAIAGKQQHRSTADAVFRRS